MKAAARGAWLVAVVLTGCTASRATLTADPELQARAGLLVSLEVEAQGPVKVHLKVPRTRLPVTPGEVQFRWMRVPEEAVRRQLRGALEPRQVSREADLELDYQVAVDRLNEGPGLYGSVDLPRGRQLALWNLLPVLKGAVRSEGLYPVVVEVRSPLPITSSLEGGPTVFTTDSPNALYAGLMLVGPVVQVQASGGLRLASFDFDAGALHAVAELEARASALLEQRYGPRGPLALLAVHAAPPGTPRNGVAGINAEVTASVLFRERPSARPSTEDNNGLLHELVHSSLPPEEHLPAWMTEGFAEYVARRLAAELDGLPPEVLRESLAATWDAFVEDEPSRRPQPKKIAAYFGGAVLAHCIDVRLRRDHSSLDAVLRKVRERAKGEIINELWEQEIALASAPAGALVLSAKTDALDPIAQCFKEDGLHLQPASKGVSPGFVRHLLGITAVDAVPRHFDVMVTAVEPGSKVLQVGDTITALDGVRVVNLAHLQQLLWARSGTATVRLEVMREGQPTSLPVPLGAVEARSTVEVERALWVKGP